MKLFLFRRSFNGLLPHLAAGCLCFSLLLSARCPSDAPKKNETIPAAAPGGADMPYDLNNPSLTINLVSSDLQEISGLSPTDTADIYCAIADERGEIFFVDGNGGGAILRRVLFRDKGDFEGVEMAGKDLYAIKSNGTVFEISKWKDPAKMQVEEFNTALTKDDDVEGLGYDPRRHALLLACKGNPASDARRKVYAFGLKDKQLSATSVYEIDPVEVNRRLAYGPEEKHEFFSPSGIAVHPVTNEVYLISTALKRMVILDPAGAIRHVFRLDKKILPQPEGIAFDPKGNLYLSSEGKKGEGLMLRFDYKGMNK